MAESSTGEKSEDPTPQKLSQARKKGQVGKSADVASAISFAASFAVLALTANTIASQLKALMIASFSIDHQRDLLNATSKIVSEGFEKWIILTLPLMVAASIMGVAANYIQIGFIFSSDPLLPKFEKINPINGFKQMFSAKKLVQLLQQITKFILVAYVVKRAVEDALYDVVLTQDAGLSVAVAVAIEIIKNIIIRVAVLFLILAVADFFWQRRVFKKSQMMSKHEVKQEYKQSEGDPQLKGDRKRLARELILDGTTKNAAQADAVITNPLLIAIAIKYDPDVNSAPILVAKGMRKNAAIIRQIADKNNIPIIRNVPLAHTLNRLEIDDEIPESLYDAVAEIINFVYELRKATKGTV